MGGVNLTWSLNKLYFEQLSHHFGRLSQIGLEVAIHLDGSTYMNILRNRPRNKMVNRFLVNCLLSNIESRITEKLTWILLLTNF